MVRRPGRHDFPFSTSLGLRQRRPFVDGALDETGRPSFEQLQQRMGVTAEAG